MWVIYLVLSLLAVLLFGVWGFVGAIIVGLALLLAGQTNKKSEVQSNPQQVEKSRTGAGWKGMANKRLSAHEIQMREMDVGKRHLGDQPSAAAPQQSATPQQSPWPSANTD